MTQVVKNKQSIKTINDRVYTINAFRGEKGWEFLPKLTKYVFPFIGLLGGSSEDGGMSDEEAGSALMSLLSADNAKEITQLIKDLVSEIEVNGMKIDFSNEFEDNYDALLILAIEVIKLNYSNSFQRLVTNLPNLLN